MKQALIEVLLNDAQKKSVAVPLTIPGLVLWLRGDGITGLSDGDPVATWSDESGEGNDAAQGTAAFRPLYKVAIQNGLAVVRFDGVNDLLRVTDLDDAFSGISEGTLFAVFAPDGDTNYGVVEFSGAADGFWRWSGDGNGYFALFRAARLAGQPTAQPTSGWHYHTIRSGAANGYQIRRNGSLDVNTTTNWGISADARIAMEGAANQFKGDIGEILVYADELTDAQVSTLETYLANKWGL